MIAKDPPRTLGDYLSLQRGTTYKSNLLGLPGPYLLGLASIHRGGGFRTDSLKTYGGEAPPKLLVKPGQLYLSLKDVTQSADLLGAVARLPLDYPPGRLTQDTVRLDPLSESVPLEYLYWLLRTPIYRTYCRAHATGTTNLGLPREDFLAFPVPEPDSSRLRLARLLTEIEGKIELNRRQNETLEAIARALFRSWFVDLDPVRAKTEGKNTKLPPRLADLFPDSFEDSLLGEVPVGWEPTTWGHIVELKYGKSLRDYGRDAGAFPVYGTNGRIGSHDEPLCRHAGIIIGRKGAYRGVHFSNTPFYVIDTAFFVEPAKTLEMRWAYYELLRQDINSMDSGSAIPSTSRDDFYNLPVVVPALSVQRAFSRLLNPFWERQTVGELENGQLALLRDTLLPKLISGELHIRDAEKFVARAV
jgi:type I restriction enzyme S subunit